MDFELKLLNEFMVRQTNCEGTYRSNGLFTFTDPDSDSDPDSDPIPVVGS